MIFFESQSLCDLVGHSVSMLQLEMKLGAFENRDSSLEWQHW